MKITVPFTVLHGVMWSSSHSGLNAKIELYKSGTSYQTISSSETNVGSYSWAIPSSYDEADNYKIRISSVFDATVYDESDANFELSPAPTITVTSPNGGEEWVLGSTHDISWTSSDVSGNISIYLFQGGSYYHTISSSQLNDGSYSWAILSGYAEANNYKIRISSVSDATVYDESDTNFELSPAHITVTSPNGGEDWELGSTNAILWSSTDYVSGNVKIELFQGGSAYQIIEGSTDNSGSYSWTIPYTYDADNAYRVRISSIEDASVYDESDDDFSLYYLPYTITSPNGGEEWVLDSTYDITWVSSFTGDVKLELFKDDVAYQIIEGSTDDDGSYSWTIPETYCEGTDYKVRISSVSNSTVYDESDANFRLWSLANLGNYSLSFDGVDDYVLVGDQSELDVGDGDFTLQAIIKVSSSISNYGYVISKRFYSIGNGYEMYVNSTGQIRLSILDGSSETGFTHSTLVNDDTWHFIHGVFDRDGNGTVYVDGIAGTGVELGQQGSIDNDKVFVIGEFSTLNGRVLDGLIDEVAIWTSALTSSEITALYNSGYGLDASSNSCNYTSSSNLQGYWKFNEGTGTSTADGSTNSNAGTIYGATWSTDVP